jgi:hypothetical protein
VSGCFLDCLCFLLGPCVVFFVEGMKLDKCMLDGMQASIPTRSKSTKHHDCSDESRQGPLQ